MASDPEKSDEFQEKLEVLASFVAAEAEQRREGTRAALEVKFYKKNYFTNYNYQKRLFISTKKRQCSSR